MSSVVLVEQRLPFIVMLASRASTYTHVIISLFAVLLLQAFPSWTIAKPPVREVTRKHRSASVTSNASTLVNPDEDVATKKEVDESEKRKQHHVSFSTKIPFNKRNSSVKGAISHNQSMKPKLPRRFSLPANRFSTHVVAALHNLTPHHRRPQVNTCFLTEEANNNTKNVNVASVSMANGDMPVPSSAPTAIIVSITRSTKVEKAEGDKGAIVQNGSYITIETSQKKRTFKQFARRASVILGDIRVHRS